MKKRALFKRGFALILSGYLFSLPVQADQNPGQVLQDYVNQLKTFTADFKQTQPDEAVFEMNASSGYFKLQRPGKLVWHYLKPEPQKIVVDGRNLWVQDDDLEQVSVRPIDEIKSEIPLSWLLYDEPIESRFTIIPAGGRDGMQWFNLEPKEATYFQSIEIGLQNGQMRAVWMYQDADNITKVRFENIRSNTKIAASEFMFSIPRHYDLIGQPE